LLLLLEEEIEDDDAMENARTKPTNVLFGWVTVLQGAPPTVLLGRRIPPEQQALDTAHILRQRGLDRRKRVLGLIEIAAIGGAGEWMKGGTERMERTEEGEDWKVRRRLTGLVFVFQRLLIH
jgi:hypothetical protein